MGYFFSVRGLKMILLLLWLTAIWALAMCALSVFVLRLLFSSLLVDTEFTVRAFKCDWHCMYNNASGLKHTVTVEDKKGDDGVPWITTDLTLPYDTRVLLHVIISMIACPLFVGFVKCLGNTPAFTTWYLAHLFVAGITYLFVICLPDIKVTHRTKATFAMNMTSSLRVTVSYSHMDGFDCTVRPIDSLPGTTVSNSAETIEEEKTRKLRLGVYNSLVSVQWSVLLNKYKVDTHGKQYIALDDIDICNDNPLLVENIQKLETIGYCIIGKTGTGAVLIYNGSLYQRKKFVDGQFNEIVRKYGRLITNRLPFDIDLEDINEENPFFEENVNRLANNGYTISYCRRLVGNRECKQAYATQSK